MVDLSSAYVTLEPTRDDSAVTVPDVITPTRLFFGENSPLRQGGFKDGRTYESRPQQVQMAETIANAMGAEEHLCIEAPTGVGKSFAYLVPGIYHALKSGLPTIISTETIALQEQLIQKDIPFLQSLMSDTPFRAALAKGRQNYLCQRRLRFAMSEGSSIPGYIREREIMQLDVWARNTEDGSLASYPEGQPPDGLWSCVCSEGGNCLYPNCQFAARCFYWKARRLWNSVHILVVNHALLFTDLKIKLENCGLGESILPMPGTLIIDEAHAVEDAAANHLGIHISERGLRYGLNRLFDPVSARGLLAAVTGDTAFKVRDMTAKLHLTSGAFFEKLKTLYKKEVTAESGETAASIDEPVIESQLRLLQPVPQFDIISDALAEFTEELRRLSTTLRDDKNYNDLSIEIAAQALRFDSYTDTVRVFMEQLADNHVYWMAQSRSGNSNLSLCSAPISVGEILRRELFSDSSPAAIMTSATLTVNDRFDYFLKRSGFRGQTCRLDSPFDYARQLTLHIPREMPEPATEEFQRRLPGAIRYYIEKTGGSAFVLFTSYSMMRQCYVELIPWFTGKNMFSMMQGETYSRSQMLDIFRDTPGSVIFGTSSFWTGVDVPGDALSNVIIVRLPFPVPSDPIIQARCEQIQQRNGNPFMDYSLPEAVIRLRQGAGRLIRSKTDRGILVILDNRILTKYYGKTFLRSLPECPRIESAR